MTLDHLAGVGRTKSIRGLNVMSGDLGLCDNCGEIYKTAAHLRDDTAFFFFLSSNFKFLQSMRGAWIDRTYFAEALKI